MRKSQTPWAQREYRGNGEEGLQSQEKERRPVGLLWGKLRSERGQGQSPGILQTSRMTVTLVDVPMEGLTQVSGVV